MLAAPDLRPLPSPLDDSVYYNISSDTDMLAAPDLRAAQPVREVLDHVRIGLRYGHADLRAPDLRAACAEGACCVASFRRVV